MLLAISYVLWNFAIVLSRSDCRRHNAVIGTRFGTLSPIANVSVLSHTQHAHISGVLWGWGFFLPYSPQGPELAVGNYAYAARLGLPLF